MQSFFKTQTATNNNTEVKSFTILSLYCRNAGNISAQSPSLHLVSLCRVSAAETGRRANDSET